MLHALHRGFFRRSPQDDFVDTELGIQIPPWPAANMARAIDEFPEPGMGARRKEAPVLRYGEAARHLDALRAARVDGHQAGFRQGYIEGMHWGLGYGVIAGALLIALLYLTGQYVWPLIAALLA